MTMLAYSLKRNNPSTTAKLANTTPTINAFQGRCAARIGSMRLSMTMVEFVHEFNVERRAGRVAPAALASAMGRARNLSMMPKCPGMQELLRGRSVYGINVLLKSFGFHAVQSERRKVIYPIPAVPMKMA